MTEDELPPEGIELVDPTWDAWQPREVAERLAGVATPWYVAAGWALDLFRGGPTREHDDLEIGVPAAGFDAVRAAQLVHALVASAASWAASWAALGGTAA